MHNLTAANQAVPLETYGGLVTLVRPENVPEGASPRNYDMDYLVGSAQTRAGLENTVSFENASAGPNHGFSAVNQTINGNAWNQPANVLTSNGAYTFVVAGGGTDALNVTAFAFALPAAVTPTGITVVVKGFATSQVQLHVQLLLAGVPVGGVKTVTLPTMDGLVSLGSVGDLWGASVAYSDVNKVGFGVRITASSPFAIAQTLLDTVTVQIALTAGNANFNFVTTFVAQDGSVKNLSLDANGNFFIENLTSQPGILASAAFAVTPGSFASGVNGPDVEYLAFNDLTSGVDLPRQYTEQWTDRISQVGPGASPIFSSSSTAATTYAIDSITQPAAQSRGFSYFLQSAGPGSNQAGNVCTVYYGDSSNSAADADLVAAFNSGQPVYLFFSFTGGPATQGPYTVLVTSVGEGNPPGQPRQFFYFTFTVPTSVYTYYQGSGHSSYSAHYQRTLATMSTSVPVPALTVGSRAVVTGNSVPAYNGTWPIAQTLNSAAMAITQTSLIGGVGTFSYAVMSGQNPVAGQLITIVNTLNGNGMLNVQSTPIAGVTGTNLGTFTIAGYSAARDYPAQAENGQGTTAGTRFTFEPGLLTLGSSASPIYGTGNGGQIVVTGSGQVTGSGTRQGVVFFITRNGYYTAPGPPVTFTTPDNTTAISATLIPIGPPNVIARGIAFTEAGQNGVPGANFFTIPTPVQYIVEGVTHTATSLFILDNTTTSASFVFTDAVLLNATAIDVQGNNLFRLIELGNPGWIVKYASRNFYGLCQNKLQNFLNLSFDGGYLPGGQLTPLGWTQPDSFGRLLVSPVFGNSYYIANTTGAFQFVLGLIAQTAYQDAYLQPILNAAVSYSLRVTARIPSGLTTGNLNLDLVAAGISYGTLDIPFASLSTVFATITGPLNVSPFQTVPAGLELRAYAFAVGAGADVEIDRIEVFPTAIPVLTTTVFASYANNLESVDAITGPAVFNSENQQPVLGAVVMYDTFYALKQQSLYAMQSSANLEPAQWSITEVAQRAGACGINAYDFGEQWIVSACRNGLFCFTGGQPGKIMQEIYQVWDAINWSAGKSIWVRNDVTGRRLFIGVPLPTPNFWLPDAPVNAAPTTPNVILMCNYQGIETGDGLKTEIPVHTTVFGSLTSVDMKRKWSIWQIPCPYAAAVSSAGDVALAATGQIDILDAEVRFCNGIASSKIYALNGELPAGQVPTDDGAAIRSLYTTYGHINTSKAAQMPLLGLFRKLWSYVTHQVSGVGTLTLRLLPNTLLGPGDNATGYYPWSVPGGFVLTDPCTQVREAPLNFSATRTFVEFSTTGRMDISNLRLVGRKHPHNELTGKR